MKELKMKKLKLKTIFKILGRLEGQSHKEILTRYYLDEDEEIAVEAVLSTKINDDPNLIEKLLLVLERGSDAVKIAVLKKLSQSNFPLLKDKLIEYYNLFQDIRIKTEIIRLINTKYFKSNEVVNLNRNIVVGTSSSWELKNIALRGLTLAGDYDFLLHMFSTSNKKSDEESKLVSVIFDALLLCDGVMVETFLKKLEHQYDFLSNDIKGKFLAVYILKVSNPRSTILKAITEEKELRVLKDFLDVVEDGINYTLFYKRVFRILLLFPYFGLDFEKKLKNLLERIIKNARSGIAQNIKELILVINVHLKTLFNKIKDEHLSLFNVKSKDDFLRRLLAWYFEFILPENILKDSLKYFASPLSGSPKSIVDRIVKYFNLAGDNPVGVPPEINRLKASLYLFFETDERGRKSTYNTLKKVKPGIRDSVAKLARLVRAAGLLKAKSLIKNITEIYEYSVREGIISLEASAIEALGRFGVDTVERRIDEAVEKMEDRVDPVILSSLMVLPFMFSNKRIELGIQKLMNRNVNLEYKKVFVNGLKDIPLSEYSDIVSFLIEALPYINDDELSEKLGEIIVKNITQAHIPVIKKMIERVDGRVRISYLAILREVYRKGEIIRDDILSNFLYNLLNKNKNDAKLVAFVTAFLMEIGDDYSFKVFKSYIEKLLHENESANESDSELIISIIKELPIHLLKRIILDVLYLINAGNKSIHEFLGNLFGAIPDEMLTEDVRRRVDEIYSGIAGKKPEGESFGLVKDRHYDGYSGYIPLIDTPRVEFQLSHERTKNLTVFFIDIVNYTGLSAKSNLTGLVKVIESFEKIVVTEIDRLSGSIVKKMGDGILATFKHPLNSIVSALSILEKIEDYNSFAPAEEKYTIRIGIHTGSVLIKDNDIFGDTVNIASRVESSAEPGNVRVTEEVVKLTSDFVEFGKAREVQLKGLNSPVILYSPIKIKENVEDYLKVLGSNLASSSIDLGENILKKLRIIMFNPVFNPRSRLKSGSKSIPIEELSKLFNDLTKFMCTIASDYIEEYEIKAWLQNKWNRLIDEL